LVDFTPSVPPTPPDATCQPADSFCQQADTEQVQQIPESSLGSAEGQSPQEDGEGQGETVDAAWVPTAADMAFAIVRRPDLNPTDLSLMTEKLLAHHSGRRLPNISGVWRRWLLTERTSHDRRDHDARRPFHHRRSAGADTHAGGNDLAARNDAAARTALDRILARRANCSPSAAGYA
jgi:hypothetical protein